MPELSQANFDLSNLPLFFVFCRVGWARLYSSPTDEVGHAPSLFFGGLPFRGFGTEMQKKIYLLFPLPFYFSASKTEVMNRNILVFYV